MGLYTYRWYTLHALFCKYMDSLWNWTTQILLGQVLIFAFCTLIQTLMSVSLTMEVASTTAMTQTEVTLVPAIMATNLTAMDILVKVYRQDLMSRN